MATKIAEPENTRRLLQVIRSRTPIEGITRMRAMGALRFSSSTRTDVFREVLNSPEELPRFKQMAVMGLYQAATPEAVETLREQSTRTRDPRIRSQIAAMLGRIGDPNALREVQDVVREVRGYPHRKASFAASLLAYRHHLDGNRVEHPENLARFSPNASRLDIGLQEAASREVRTAVSTLEPIGLEIATERAYQIQCDPNTFLFLWNEETTGGNLSGIFEKKAVMGVIGRKSRFEKAYALSSFVLVTPDQNGNGEAGITIHKPDGKTVYAGTLTQGRSQLTFHLRAVQHPGVTPVTIDGSIDEDGAIQFEEAVSSDIARERKTPTPVSG